MGYVFTQDQQERIQTAVDEAEAGGSWAKAYELVAEIAANEPDANGAQPIKTDPEVQASRLWLLGAAQANSGEGAFSALIRDYTARQYELHFGEVLPEQLGQAASNAVASQVLDTALSQEALPTLAQIADQDATAVGETLFDATPGGEGYDDAVASDQANAAWSGSVLFSFFDNGQIAADQTDRLLSTGDSDARLDSVNDLRDVVFAYHAFTRAFDPVRLAVTSLENMSVEELEQIARGESQASDLDVAQAILGFGGISPSEASTVLDGDGGFLAAATRESAAGNAFAWVEQLGAQRLIDALDSVLDTGVSSGGGDFAERAHGVFSGLKEAGQLDLRVQRLDRIAADGEPSPGQPLSTDALVSAARSGGGEGKAVLFALHRGNPVVVLGRDAGETAALYERFDTDGFLDAEQFSEQYLQDRATYLSQLHVETDAGGSQDGVNDVRLRDLDSGTTIGSPSPLSPVWAFGGDEADPVTGSTIADSPDRLYGGRGDDLQRGLAGDDRLEGQGGDDALEGGSGDDLLRGGRGDDDLRGGAGDDTYRFESGHGSDRIADVDGIGTVEVGDSALTEAPATAATLTLAWRACWNDLHVMPSQHPNRTRWRTPCRQTPQTSWHAPSAISLDARKGLLQ